MVIVSPRDRRKDRGSVDTTGLQMPVICALTNRQKETYTHVVLQFCQVNSTTTDEPVFLPANLSLCWSGYFCMNLKQYESFPVFLTTAKDAQENSDIKSHFRWLLYNKKKCENHNQVDLLRIFRVGGRPQILFFSHCTRMSGTNENKTKAFT